MKTPSKRRIETAVPRPGIAARAIYSAFVGLTIVAFTVGYVGLITASFAAVLTAVGAGGLAWWSRGWLVRRGAFETAARSFDERDAAEERAGGPVRELVGLLEEWDQLERRRGSPEFDPWELQSLRRDIQRVLDETPALRILIQR